MDPATHGLVGAAAALLVAPRRPSVKAPASEDASRLRSFRALALAGALAAMSADLDVLLNLPSDPLFQLEFHRQFSHAVLFTPLAALLVSAALWPLLRSRLQPSNLGFGCLYATCLLGYATAGPLDACTSYGTQLLWPFSSARIAWNLVPVVDPLLTLGLLMALALALKTGRRLWTVLALVWLGLNLCHGALQKNRAAQASLQRQQQRGHRPQEIVIKPTLGNQMLWRVNYLHDGRVYADAVWTLPGTAPRLYPGESAPLVVPQRDFPELDTTVSGNDLERFARLSEGYLVRHPGERNAIGDARYAMLPNSLSPLWAVRFNPAAPDRHVEFRTYRDSSPEVRTALKAMLLGRPLK